MIPQCVTVSQPLRGPRGHFIRGLWFLLSQAWKAGPRDWLQYLRQDALISCSKLKPQQGGGNNGRSQLLTPGSKEATKRLSGGHCLDVKRRLSLKMASLEGRRWPPPPPRVNNPVLEHILTHTEHTHTQEEIPCASYLKIQAPNLRLLFVCFSWHVFGNVAS